MTKVGLVSLGCPKNQVDSEIMLAKITASGYKLVDEAGKADVVIINTCGFIQSAKEEAIEEILEAISRKNDGINKHIILTGCLAERYGGEMKDEFPEVDCVLPLGANDQIVAAIEAVTKGVPFEASAALLNLEGERLISTLPHYAYLRIADGCDNRCTYCAIPLIRGGFRSRPIENILAEAESLTSRGVRELVVIAQDTTRYGEDLYGQLKLTELLHKLCLIDDVKWIRLLYCYPDRMTDELIETIKTEAKVLPYIEMPLQHCDEVILRRMNRHGDRAALASLIKKMRREIPELVLRTTFITGFPAETDEQFTQLAEFAEEIKFEHLGCFAYSEEENTPAAGFAEQIDTDEREHRRDVIIEQQEIRNTAYWASLIGETLEVVCEGFDKYAEVYFGRSYHFAPEIDGLVYFTSTNKLHIGDFVNVEIIETDGNNLIGTIAE
ncbi:MAG: 30S ribosomal protein S12 methylthiotransferase RimO [Oscillospiraceae bacterium]|jgi:ribosomal protein S12 methylthiotransferase|nr:30S ribosomal protein S12 methylthiotransferase RimO [Oscillospiraceae bacterium]